MNKKIQDNESDQKQVIIQSQVAAYDRIRKGTTYESSAAGSAGVNPRENAISAGEVSAAADGDQHTSVEEEKEEEVEIDPCQSLFDRHISATAEENAEYLYKTYGFFIPDREFLTDLEGLLGYCQEKIQIGHLCLYCQKKFASGSACTKHMRSSTHTKLRYEADIDLHEFDVFYDFSAVNQEFMQNQKQILRGQVIEDNDDWEICLKMRPMRVMTVTPNGTMTTKVI